MELVRVLLTGLFFFSVGIAAGIVLSSNYYEELSVAVSRYGGYTAVFLAVMGFFAGLLAGRIRRQRFNLLTVGRVERVGMDVVRAVNASLKRAGMKKVVEK